MVQLFPKVTDLAGLESSAANYRYGYIETRDGQLSKIQFRPWPKLISGVEALWLGGWKHDRLDSRRCRLYFNQPLWHSNYLILAYIEATLGSSFRNFRLAMQILDWVAFTKRSDAILCEVTNPRISDRLLKRWGWERHLGTSSKRHWIKRFYGDYSSVMLASEIR